MKSFKNNLIGIWSLFFIMLVTNNGFAQADPIPGVDIALEQSLKKSVSNKDETKNNCTKEKLNFTNAAKIRIAKLKDLRGTANCIGYTESYERVKEIEKPPTEKQKIIISGNGVAVKNLIVEQGEGTGRRDKPFLNKNVKSKKITVEGEVHENSWQ